jgi:hypothetical protein
MSSEPIFIVCDACVKPNWIGLSADSAVLKSLATLFSDNTTRCIYCGNAIVWSKAELVPLSIARQRFPEQFSK